jgi:hypothetical protein
MLNFEHQGKPIAIIMKKDDNKESKLISLDDNSNSSRSSFLDYKIDNINMFMQPVGDPHKERDIIYITGKSGSGKSYYICNWVNNYYKKCFPKRSVYLFSALTNDPTIDKIKGLKRINLNDEFLYDDEITVLDFKNSCVIFDDTDTIKSKPIRNKVNHLLNEILETGRHTNTTCLISKHLACKGNETKLILSESQQFVFFPNGLGGRALKYLLENYMSLDKKQISRIKKLKSRYICVNQSVVPNVIISEKDIYVLNNDDD